VSLSLGPASDATRQLTGKPSTSGLPWTASIGRMLLSRRTHIMPGGLVSYLHPTLADIDLSLPGFDAPGSSPLASAQLAAITDHLAERAVRWRPIVRHDPQRRWYTRLVGTDSVEVWLLGWTPGQHVPAHDHGGAAGAFTVVDGALVEDQLDPCTWGPRKRTTFTAGSRTHFGPAHAHILGNRGTEAATSVHAYSPPGLPLRFGWAGPASPARPSCWERPGDSHH
jgi:predicted metal-dependent enzyme (double-stranded beta helix superfamily)